MSDVYLLDSAAQKSFQEETKGRGLGVLCPKRNLSINGKCYVCDEVARLFGTGNKVDKDVAFLKMAKANFYMTCVTKDKPNEVFILEMGKKAGNAILDGVTQRSWNDIAHPLANKGREMMISKVKGLAGFAEYQPSPSLEKADWEVPKEALDKRPNLDNIISLLKDKTVPVRRVSDMKEGETITFRILPPWDNGQGNKRFMTVVWRHYGGVTQGEVDGSEPIDVNTTGKEEKPTQTTSNDPMPWDDQPEENQPKHEKCFGLKQFYEEGDKTCRDCKDFKACAREVLKHSS